MEIQDWAGEQPAVSTLAKHRQRDKRYRKLVCQHRQSGYSRLCSHQMANGELDALDYNRKRAKN